MNFLIFVFFYIICTSILLLILYFVFTKFYANKLVDHVIKQAFDNKDIDNLTSLLNDFSNSQSDESKNNDNRLFF